MKMKYSKRTAKWVRVLAFSTIGLASMLSSIAHSQVPMPTIYAGDVEGLSWEPFIPNIKKEVLLGANAQRLNLPSITGKVGAITIPADRGTLDITVTSVIEDNQVFMPNVLVLDENLQVSAFFSSEHFKYSQAGILSPDSVEGKIQLTPAIGQKQIYLLIFTRPEDLQDQTQMLASAKAFAAGTGHAIPNIPDPIAKHTSVGKLLVEVKAQNQTNNAVIVGLPLFNKQEKSVVDLNQIPQKSISTKTKVDSPILKDTANYFDEQIKQAVGEGDINKALKLLEEAETLGSKTARKTFVSSVEGR